MPTHDGTAMGKSPAAFSASGDPGMREGLGRALGPNYELRDLIGRGGFAEVYIAWDRRLEREVAVKTLRTDVASSPGVAERFRREAQIVAQLRHPHVVPIYEVGDAGGIAYLIMPRIRGESVADAMAKRTHWSFAEVCRILREAAGALAEAHRNGVVHRDVKPENIMLEAPNEQVVVMDFGIAKSLGAPDAGLTGTGMLIGTPQYMSPEQAAGDVVTALSDQYSLALVGYRLLAGQLPFQADSMRELLLMQVTADVPAVSEFRPDVPESLARALSKALENDSSKRYESMAQFADALATVGSQVAGEFRIARHSPPIADRWAAALHRTWYRPAMLIAATVIGLALFAFAYPRAESGAARAMVGGKAEAVFAARGALPPSVVGASHAERHQLLGWSQGDGSEYRFLQAALGRDSAEVRASTDIPARQWLVSYYRNSPADLWFVWVGPARRITMLRHVLPDSARRPDRGDDSSLAIARTGLAKFGWRPADILLVRRSTTEGPSHTTRTYSWAIPARSIVLGSDTGVFQLLTAVTGDEVTWYQEYLRVPDGFHRGLSDAGRQALSAIGLAVIMVLLIAAAVIAVRRASRDTPQWGTGMRIGSAALGAGLVTVILPRLYESSVPFAFGQSRLGLMADVIRGNIPEYIGAWLLITICFVAAESLTNEARPDLTEGLGDLSRGRLLIPEWVPSTLAGYPAGLLGIGVITAAFAVSHALGAPLDAGVTGSSLNTPLLDVLSTFIWLVTAGMVLFLSVAIGVRLHRPPILICAVIMPLCWVYRFGSTGAAGARLIIEMVAIALAGLFLDRFGVLATLVALFVGFGVPVVTDAFWAGGVSVIIPGAAAIAALLLPAALAAIAYRRRV